MVDRLYGLVTSDLLPALAANGIRIASPADLDAVRREALAAYFRDDVLPVLTPLAVDTSRPFPMLSSLSVNLALRLAPAEEGLADRIAVVQVPSGLPRLVRVAGGEGVTFVVLDDVIRAGLDSLFPGQVVLEAAAFRLTRDSELELDDEGGQSYVEALEVELRRRRKSDVVRLEIDGSASGVLASLHRRPRRARRRGRLPRARVPRPPRALGHRGPAGVRGPARPGHEARAGARRGRRRPHLRRPRRGRPPRAPPVRRVRAGPRPGGAGRRRPGRARDQADALPARVRLARGRGADARRRPRQAGDGGRRADGALRRGAQPPLGAGPRRGRRARHLRHPRAEGPREVLHGGPPHAPGPPPLRARRHRELQPPHRAALHRRRAPHLVAGDRRGRVGVLQRPDRLLRSAADEEARHVAGPAARSPAQAHRAGDRGARRTASRRSSAPR